MSLKNAGAALAFHWLAALAPGVACAATYTITANTNWSALGPQPGIGDTIIVKNGATLTVNVANAQAATVALGAGNPNRGQGTLSFSAPTSQLTVAGNVTLGFAGPPAQNGNVSMASGGTLILGGFTSVAVGTFARGTGTVVLTASNTLPSAAAYNTFNNLTVSANTTTLSQNLTIAGGLGVSGGTMNTSTRTLTVNGNTTVDGTLTLTNTTTMNGATTIGGTLSITSAAGTKTFVGNVTLNGTWSNAVAGNVSIQGNLANNGTLSAGTATYAFNGAAVQTLSGTSGATTLGVMTLNNASGLALGGTHNLTVTTLLTLSAGRLTTGSNTVYISNGSAVSGATTGRFIEGNLKKPFSSANLTRNFEVGGNGGTNYSPVGMTFTSITTGGDVTVSSTAGVHPQVGSSGLDDGTPALLNRYWAITNSGIVFGSYAAAFAYVATEVDAAASPATFLAMRYDGASWNPTTLSGAPTTTGLTVTGEPGFGAFAIGNSSAPTGALGHFNAYDPPPVTPAGSVTGNIRTKVAGTPFTLTAVHLNNKGDSVQNLNDNIAVDLLDGSPTGGTFTNNCSSNWTTVIASVAGSISGGNYSTSVNFTVTDAYPDVRVRVTRAGGAEIGCSNDNFAIRPDSIALEATDSDWLTSGTARPLYNASGPIAPSNNNVHAASAPGALTTPRPFTLRATAKNAAGTKTANYAGTLTVKSGPTCVSTGSCSNGALDIPIPWVAVAGDFTASAQYSEAGTFTIEFEDATFAGVDASDTALAVRTIPQRMPGGAPGALEIGRFVPERFVFSSPNTPQLQTFGSSCASRFFTYVGQPFWFVTLPAATLSAVNAGAGSVTTNYPLDTSLGQPAVTETFSDATAPANAPLNTGLAGTPPTVTGAGTGSYAPSASGRLSYTRHPANVVAPFNAAVSLSVVASDGNEVPPASSATGNGTISTSSPLVFDGGGSGIAFDVEAQLRYGVVRLQDVFAPLGGNASGRAPVAMQAQYWNGSAFVLNGADNCSAFVAKNFVLSSHGGAVNATNAPTPSAGSNGALSLPTGTLSGGVARVEVSAPSPAITSPGNVRICLDLDGSPVRDASCGAVTPANQPYLQGRWAASAQYDRDPNATIGLGLYGAQPRNFIFFRENY